MGVIGFKDRTKHGGSSHTIVVASDRLENGRFRTVAYEKYIPEKLPTDVLLLVRETGTLYVGTGTGIEKVADKVKIDPGTGEHIDLSEYLKATDADNKYAKKEDLTNIGTGKSAYASAVENGYVGSEQDWIASLKGADGKSAYQVAVDKGYVGNEETWLASLKGEKGVPGEQGIMGPTGSQGEAGAMGPAGKSAYQIAVEKGFIGDEQAWLNSLKGQDGLPGKNGIDGESAYQIAQRVNSFVGSESDWLNSLRGSDGLPGLNGTQGENGKSAYQIAVEKGFVGDEQAWLESLKGQDGITPSTENFVQKEDLNEYVTFKKFNDLKNEFEKLKAKVEAAHP